MTTQTFPLDGPINLQARLGHGSITVNAEDDATEAAVTLTPRVKGADILERIAVELSGRTLSITAPRKGGVFDLPFFGGHGREAVDVVVTVPTGTATKISTFTADITVRGRIGGADIAAGASNIDVDRVGGDLRLRYGSGACTVAEVTGSVEARSGAGSARFGRIGGSLTSGCGSGELEVRSVHGRVRSRSGSGSASLGAVYDDVDLASGSGPVRIGVPAGQRARLDLTTGSGEVDSDLPISSTPLHKGRAITIRARTGSGDIRLFRARQDSSPDSAA
jgi:hypothetical protein